MTSIMARCPRTGQLGIGVASFSMAIGLYCDGAMRANTGVTLTQGFPNPRNNHLAINLLAQGRTAGQALSELISQRSRQRLPADRDRRPERRSRSPIPATSLRQWAGHRIGKGYVAFGDGLAGPAGGRGDGRALRGTASAELDERLLAALEAGRDAGGMAAPKGACRSARQR